MRLRGKRLITAIGTIGLTAATLTAVTTGPAGSAPTTPAASGKDNGVVRTAPGNPIDRPQGFSADSSPSAVAKAFVAQGDDDLAVKGDVTTARVEPSARGGSVVRLQQTVNGIPVLGSQVVVDLDRNNNIRTATSEALPGAAPSTTYGVSAQDAADTAIGAAAKASKSAPESLQASKPSKWIYDPRILGGPGLPQARAVWRVQVTSATDPSIRRMVLVDGVMGSIAFNLDEVNEAKVRRVCNANNTASQVPCVAPVRVEGQPPNANPEVNKAYDYAGDTYNFFKNRFNRDSLNNAGMPLINTVRYCDPSAPCPFQNAFWNGQQMVYGQGFANADDVVGHELQHGITEFTSDLFYYMQSGAINESLSDIFGEFVDQTNGKGNDTPAVKWLMGEDLPASFGVIRNMKNPPQFNDPDRTGSPIYHNALSDNGGVHINSGVSNKFTFLITDGGTFNGRTVTGLGLNKAALIIYRASQLLTSASDFRQFAAALRAACNTLVGTNGITVANCGQVNNALLATQMDATPVRAPLPAAAPVCPTGKAVQNIWTDGLENPNANWTRNAQGAYRFIYTNEQYGMRYATQGRSNVWAPQLSGTSDLRMQRTGNWLIPAGQVFLRFAHAFEFETPNYDGGVIEYSINNGTTWLNAGPLIVNNGYRGTLANGNPLAGRAAYVGVSRGYITTRLNMAPLVGKSVRFRFRTTTDSSVGWYGWFVDDVRLYKCV